MFLPIDDTREKGRIDVDSVGLLLRFLRLRLQIRELVLVGLPHLVLLLLLRITVVE